MCANDQRLGSGYGCGRLNHDFNIPDLLAVGLERLPVNLVSHAG
jgi:hypothetical protein